MSICGRSDHQLLFCPFCYHTINFNRSQPTLRETSPVQYLILADNINQAFEFAQRNNLEPTVWLWIVTRSTLALRPEARIVCVREELYREDLLLICQEAFDTGREIEYENGIEPS